MGRKIPAKKHHGVKDPKKQQEQRWKKIKTKINAPPRDPDEQPVPRSLARLFGLPDGDRTTAKENDRHKKNNKTSHHNEIKNKGKKISPSNKNPVSCLQRLPDESGRAFSLRINSAIRTLNDRTDNDYPMDLNEENDVKGDAMLQRNQRRAKKQAQKLKQAAAAMARAGEGQGEGHGRGQKSREPARSRGRTLTLKKKAKKEKIEQSRSAAAAEVQYERLLFGDVAHAPPTLSVKPRQVRAELAAPRPGSRPLLLTAMFGGSGSTGGTGVQSADRLHRERARLDAVAAYRMIKKHKHSQQTASVL